MTSVAYIKDDMSPNPEADEEAKLLEKEDSFEEAPGNNNISKAQGRNLKKLFICLTVSFLIVALLSSALAYDGGNSIARVKAYFENLVSQNEAEEANPEILQEETSEELPQEEDAVDVTPEMLEDDPTVSIVHELAPNGYLDTLRPMPEELTADRTEPQKYLAYLPHSGFHNERVELQNALLLGSLLNRTVIVPRVRLGAPMPWAEKSYLEELYKSAQKSTIIEKCRPLLDQLEALHHSKWTGDSDCAQYHLYIESTWPLLVNLSALPVPVQLVDRADTSPAFFTKPVSDGGLGLRQDQIYNIEDTDRYDVRVYEQKKDSQTIGKYKRRLDVEDLRTDARSLIYFGSLFGSGRVRVTTPASRQTYLDLWEAMVFRNTFLDSISKEISHRLGGRDQYIGVHLRVGNGAFQANAAKNMVTIFNRLCKRLGVDQTHIDTLFAENSAVRPTKRSTIYEGEHKRFDLTDSLDASDFTSSKSIKVHKRQNADLSSIPKFTTEEQLPLHNSLNCRLPLHTDPALQALNRPIYIATDSHNPLTDKNMAVFFNSLPCTFLLTDFAEFTPVSAEPLRDLVDMGALRNQEDGVRLGPLLYPFLEAEIIARSRLAVLGTPGSTFSGFAAHSLHDVYALEEDDFTGND